MMEDFEPLTVAQYALEAATTDQGSDASSLSFPLLGLFGETGSLLSVVKKKQRDHASYLGYAMSVENGTRRIARGETTHLFLNREMKQVRLPAKYWARFGIGPRTTAT